MVSKRKKLQGRWPCGVLHKRWQACATHHTAGSVGNSLGLSLAARFDILALFPLYFQLGLYRFCCLFAQESLGRLLAFNSSGGGSSSLTGLGSLYTSRSGHLGG